MKSLTISDETARSIFPSATPDLKRVLLDTYGEPFFSLKITDRVESFEDILAISGRTMESLINGCDTDDEFAYKQAKLIAQVYNEGTVLDPNNLSQYKYYPWFEITPGSGFGLSYGAYGRWYSLSLVGVRLCFKSRELAMDAGKKFTEIYAALLIK